MLVLASYIITDIPQNLKNLLFYKQEKICHSRWITIANGYIRTLIFNSKNLTVTQKNKIQKVVSYIVCVYPSFLMIHLNPKAPEGLFLSIFYRNLLSCFIKIDPNITDAVMKYFLAHASQRLSWKNVALSVHAKIVPYNAEAVKSSKSLLEEVDMRSLFQDRRSRLKHFLTNRSNEAPCISMTRV